MTDDQPHFDEQGRLIAPKYDDVYFSADDGLAETTHVFLEGNDLAKRFAAMQAGQVFTIGETGFGTGLNFLAAWQMFEQHAPADARLEFVSVEGMPLQAETMQRALSPWPVLAKVREALLKQWGPIWPGTHRFCFAGGRVRLTLLVGEAVDVLASLDASVDAWFLDGFAPARNPAMWSDEIFQQLARLSGTRATLATYTAAGAVRRGLESFGFEIQKRPGFGSKRDMTVGRWGGSHTAWHTPSRAIVIGGSIAGAMVANALAERGIWVDVIDHDAMIGEEPLSLSFRTAVLQPKVNDQDDLAGRFLREGFALMERRLRVGDWSRTNTRWYANGSFHAAFNDWSERRLRRFIEQFGSTGLCRWIEADQTKREVGLEVPFGGVVIDSAGILRPAGLVAGLLESPLIRTHFDQSVTEIDWVGDRWRISFLNNTEQLSTELLIVANAMNALKFKPLRSLDLRPVRGQVTRLKSLGEAGRLLALRRNLFCGCYVTPPTAQQQWFGASYISGDTSTEWRREEHHALCDRLARVLPDEANYIQKWPGLSGWAGVRVETPNRRPYAEQIDRGLYVSLGHGSHGIASAAHAAEHLACLITNGPRVRMP